MEEQYTVAYVCGGIGGGALGFNGARAEYMGKMATFKSICSIDSDPIACKNYERITGGNAIQMDLFSREQYMDFHDAEPPAGWQEVTAWDIWLAFGEQVPDVIFTSPPCKGFSGLLPEKSAQSKRYQALNRLTIRSIDLVMRACLEYGGYLPKLFLLENVPRIVTRGKVILAKIKNLLRKYNFAVNDETHDCGEIGGLGQRRKRYLLISRNESRMPAFVYKPEKKPLKTIGDVIGHLPLPGDPEGGPLHRLPMLQRKTWERLALIPAGGDWRDLESVEFKQYRLEYEPRGAGAFGVQDWNKSGNTVTGNARINGSSANAAVADQRPMESIQQAYDVIYRVVRHSAEVGDEMGDPRLPARASRHGSVYQIVPDDEPAPCVTGTRLGSGAIAFADSRVMTNLHPDSYGVQDWEKPSKTIRGASRIMQSASSIADPRLAKRSNRYPGTFRVESWDRASNTILGQTDVQCGAPSIGDPRPNAAGGIHPSLPDYRDRCVMVIRAEDGTWHRPMTTYELAALQGFPSHLPSGRPFQLVDCSDAKAREYIGNAVPPDAAEGMANTILLALVMSEAEVTFEFSFQEVWVMPEEEWSSQLVH